MIASRVFLASLVLTSSLFAADVITLPTTPEQLAARGNESPIQGLTPLKSPTEAKVVSAASQSFIGQSEILSDGTRWTLLPKGSLLHVPGSMSSRIGTKPSSGQLVVWADFLAANRAWIASEEVSFDQASGKTAIAADHSAFWPKQGKVIVAVHQGGPISVKAAPTTAQR